VTHPVCHGVTTSVTHPVSHGVTHAVTSDACLPAPCSVGGLSLGILLAFCLDLIGQSLFAGEANEDVARRGMAVVSLHRHEQTVIDQLHEVAGVVGQH